MRTLMSRLLIISLINGFLLISQEAVAAPADYLAQIAQNTKDILARVNDLPAYVKTLTDLANSWLLPDTSETTATLQENLANFGNAVLQNDSVQNSVDMQRKLNTTLLGTTDSKLMPHGNDILYSTILNMPFFKPVPNQDEAYNFIKNVSGINISHVMPSIGWRGSDTDKTNYTNYYNAVMSAQSLNGYIFSGMYADYMNGRVLNQMQTTLVTQASNSTWFATVASEKIGVVLRQLLMYQSQIFVLMTEVLQTQKQMLATQALTNTLMILTNQSYESVLYHRAAALPMR